MLKVSYCVGGSIDCLQCHLVANTTNSPIYTSSFSHFNKHRMVYISIKMVGIHVKMVDDQIERNLYENSVAHLVFFTILNFIKSVDKLTFLCDPCSVSRLYFRTMKF